jgi:N-acetylglucosamine-6-phosphate deacetylase
MKTVVAGWIRQKRQQILIEDGVIRKIGSLSPTDLEGAVRIDTDSALYPGFLDIHVHGGGGADTMDASPEAFRTIAQTHAAHGTTGLLLTTMTEHVDRIQQVLQTLTPGFDSGGAAILGFHLEGPFISPKRPGAQSVRHILEPNLELLDQWIRLAQGQMRLMTIAPELANAEAVIRFAAERGIVVSMGHSAATYEEARRGKTWGARSVTHLCNAMNGMHHREPGLFGFALEDDEMFVELIADFLHVHPAVVKMIVRTVGTERLLLMTDAMRAACMGDGVYELGGQTVHVQQGKAQLADGTIAGSTLTMDQAVRNLVGTGLLAHDAIGSVTACNQARLFGWKKGRLEVGYDGDVVALDADLHVTHTIVAGRLVYRK